MLSDLSLQEFSEDFSLLWITERGLEIRIQNLLDISAHILAYDIKNDWDDYRDIILKLGHHGIIPMDFSEKIQSMAGLKISWFMNISERMHPSSVIIFKSGEVTSLNTCIISRNTWRKKHHNDPLLSFVNHPLPCFIYLTDSISLR